MSYPYDQSGRPQPHITIPVASSSSTGSNSYYSNSDPRPPPVPPKPANLSPIDSNSNWNSGGFGYPHSQLQPSQASWEQYAEAANLQYNPVRDHYEGHGYERYENNGYGDYGYEHEHRYGYLNGNGNGGERTPNATQTHRNGNGYDNADEDYFSNPFSPSASPTASYYHMHEGIDAHGRSRQSSYATDLQRPASYTEGCSPVTTSTYDPDGGGFAFPEPEVNRSLSQRAHAPSIRRQAISDIGPAPSLHRNVSYASSYAPSLQSVDSTDALTEELSNLTLESEEGLRRFQAGELAATDEEWHKLVPETAREALGEKEVQRQSILFEIFKSERDYVRDLETVFEVIVDPLRTSNVFGEGKADEFIYSTFWNLHDVLSFHQRMLGSLFVRQQEQHPLIHSVSDIILETVLQFQPPYEEYIKHYPLSEARHRKEHKHNPAYRSFLQNVSQNPRIRKRDLVTFLSRPVTRLPRLSLLLETLLKKTDEDHPDQDSMPLIIGILGDFVKSTQPGIEAAESRVKFWNVMENLVFRKGEIMDLDEQDESRTLVHSQTLARRLRSEIDWHGWNDFFVVLLDHYLLITREWKRPSGVKYEVASRPIPLEFLRLGQFDQPPETRKERSEEGSLLDNLRSQQRPQYPFTIYHAAAKSSRRYTLYTNTEAGRRKWRDVLTEAIVLHQARQDANKWFAPSTIDDGVFRVRSVRVPLSSTELFTGAITAAATFASGGSNFLIVGCEGGIYVSMRGEKSFRRVLTFQNATYITALQEHKKILLLTDNTLLAYSMDIMARVSQGSAPPKSLDASMEKVSGTDNVTLAKAGIVKDRTVVVYAAKSFRQTTMHVLEALQRPVISRFHPNKSSSFKPFGSPFYVPRTAYDITILSKTIAIAGEKGVMIVDPTNLSGNAVLAVPDCTASSQDPRVADLKARCDESKPLGLARVSKGKNMVIYEDFGCYIDRHGLPLSEARVVRWECKASRFVDRQEHVLLFSSEFIEIRHKATGRLVQVIEGVDIHLHNAGYAYPGPIPSETESVADGEQEPLENVPILISRRGKWNDVHGQSFELLELLKTSPIISSPVGPTPVSPVMSMEQIWRL
ncbi:hypothetical protein A7U60_g8226 [Sanghuangporus baumii]|uniref:Rho1 guanine nucleotide exchange factor 1 n=1 Tax=Sanghuangporus baumii TaxID=108892 RepID=A0A9Q5MYL2_SANBA|nr:hypothetical protein A7U60_g8226 [Sanghuangporus baumii]